MKLHKKLQVNIQRICCAAISVILLLTCFSISASAAENNGNVIKVGSFEGIYNTVNEKGERSGYGYEYLQGIAGYSGWSYEYVNSSWEECFEELEKGNIDILGGISYTEKRAEKMLFSAMPMGQERYYIYTNAANSDISAGNLSSFKGKKIGVLKNHIPEDVLKEWESEHNLKLKHLNVSSTEEIMDKMEKKEIDCFVSIESSTWSALNIFPVTNIGESNIYFAIRKDRPDIKETLDNVMRRIKDDNPFYTDNLYERYLSAQRSTVLSEDEKEWIANHGAVIIGYLNNDIGVSVKNPETGEVTGVITDYVEHAKNSLQGLSPKFELKGYDTREQQLEALHNGEIDLIFHVSQNPYSAETNGFVLSDTVWTFNMVALTTKNDFNENAANSIAVSKDNLALEAYVSYNYPQWTIKKYETIKAAFRAMEKGDVDCFLCNSGMVSDYLKSNKLRVFFLTESADASFGIRRGEPELLSIMNKTLMSLSTSKISGAVVSYSNTARKVTPLDFFKDNAGTVLIFLLLIVTIVCILLLHSIHNGKKAKVLNSELENALREANYQSEIIGSISKIYSIIYRIDLRDGTYEDISPDMKKEKPVSVNGPINEAVADEYREIMGSFMDFSSMPGRFRDMDSVSIEYRTTQNTWQMAQLIVKNRDDNGDVTEVLYTVRPIDKQKETENRYKQKLLFNSRVLSGLSMDYTIAIVLNLDTDSYEIAFNQSTNHAKRENGIETFREYVSNYAENFVLPEFKDAMIETLSSEAIKRRFASEEEFHFFFETMPNAAGLSYFQAHIVKEYDEGGHFAFLGFRSVDGAVKQERGYKQLLQNQLNLITSSLPGGVKISNDDSTYSFKYVSEQFASMLGYSSPEDLMDGCGGSIAGLAHPDDLQTGIADALDQYSRANHYATTYRMKCKDGSYKYIEDRGQKVITADGTVEHWNLILDKNDLMEKTIALESAKKASKSKSDFLARMSHDMRTPLNGIIGLIKINQNHFDELELVKENYRKMQVSANHLLSLINDVLQMSKIEDGTVPFTHEAINFTELSGEILAMIEHRAEDNDIKLEFRTCKDRALYPDIYGSPLHLKQIFMNIYDNCIKYNHPGGKITTVADFDLDKEGRCIYRWTISDTGIGMNKEFLKQIFEPFAQEKVDARSVYQGVGLGMPIVKGLVDRMGGTVTAESEEGTGSVFKIMIPFEVVKDSVKKSAKEEKTDVSVRGLKLLLAEDNELNAEIVQTILEDEGAAVTMTANGKQAVEMFENSSEGSFDAILMDIMMPVMDGYEATKTIRNLNRPDAKRIPIVSMTANAFAEDEEKCLTAGMNAHLTKPLETDKLMKILYEQVKLYRQC